MTLCETCGGKGTIFGIQGGAHGVDAWSKPCPAGCVAIVHTVVTYGVDDGKPETRYYDPESVLLWCKTHGSVARRPTDACEARLLAARKAYDRSLSEHARRDCDRVKNEACHIVPYEMPTEPLGELA